LTDVSSDAARDHEVSRDCVVRASLASWWKWKDDSTLFFRRWPPSSDKWCKMVFQCLWVENCLTASNEHDRNRTKGPRLISSANCPRWWLGDMAVSKGLVKSLTSFFSVPKGEDDICMFYDVSASGLDDALWAPNFGLPDVDSVLTQVVSRRVS